MVSMAGFIIAIIIITNCEEKKEGGAMKERFSWLKKWGGTLFVGFLTLIFTFMLAIHPVEKSYAGHGGGNAAYGLGGALAGIMIGACMANQMAQDRTANKATVIVTDPNAGKELYNGVYYPPERCSYYEDTGELAYCK